MAEAVAEKSWTGCCAWLRLEEFPAIRGMHLGRSSRGRKCHRGSDKRLAPAEPGARERRATSRIPRGASFVVLAVRRLRPTRHRSTKPARLLAGLRRERKREQRRLREGKG